MDFAVAKIDTVQALQMSGELDLDTIDLLTGLLDEAAEAGGPFVVDMTSLRFIDSVGIRALLNVATALERSGWCLYLHVDDGEVGRALDLVGIGKARNIHIIDHRGAHTPVVAGAREAVQPEFA
jgi:anti-anti-sigma factor